MVEQAFIASEIACVSFFSRRIGNSGKTGAGLPPPRFNGGERLIHQQFLLIETESVDEWGLHRQIILARTIVKNSRLKTAID
ncbi:hypothetical protein [Aquibacillus salsiterrae]|uniref:Uncharacterized protein n=1 Tax=Aquibacillus salsiterrae TaxID=2950439 RepID=A0A9X4ADT8_9BACI|nr:hypothetical protein [Aquibacillus salsiterrae]MDC3415856.1 hypothetical protein [Aquibacillus salsiterrae]